MWYPQQLSLYPLIPVKSIDKNIGNHRYIGISILRICWRYIDEYFEKKFKWSKVDQNL